MKRLVCFRILWIMSAVWFVTAIPSAAQTLTTLASFDVTNGDDPYSTLIQGVDGNFYGTTELGGANNSSPCFHAGCGTIFRVTPSGALVTVHNFDGSDGFDPHSGLLLATNGSFYGTTTAGGAGGGGTVFRITQAGMLTTLHSFNGSDGSDPLQPLIQANDGNLYGTTFNGGPSDNCNYTGSPGCGTVF